MSEFTLTNKSTNQMLEDALNSSVVSAELHSVPTNED